MSDLNFLEKSHLEKLFQMNGGYVLNFTNRTFQEFIADAVKKDIDDKKYSTSSSSKAGRLREFWRLESNYVVGSLTQKMAEYAEPLPHTDQELVSQGRAIAARLLISAPVPEIDAIVPITDDRTFDALTRSVHDSIEKNEPESGLDRLHTYVVKFIRIVCRKHGLAAENDKPLHSIFGEYVKHLHRVGRIESEMSGRILKSWISIFESFNHVRNNHSFAHDNRSLSYHESLLIFNFTCAAVRFIQSTENYVESPTS